MAEKEERILVVKLGGRNCPVLSNDNICVLDYDCEDCHAGFSRAEAVERMAKAINKERCRPALKEDVYWQEDKKELLREAEAALNALLEENTNEL